MPSKHLDCLGVAVDVRAILIPGTAVSATFLIAEEFRTVRLIELVTITGGPG